MPREPAPHHPPLPPGFARANLAGVEEAVGRVVFPIEKQELVDEMRDGTVILGGVNVDLAMLIGGIPDDAFESEEEFLSAMEERVDRLAAQGRLPLSPDAPGALPTGPDETWQSREGPGEASGKPPDFPTRDRSP